MTGRELETDFDARMRVAQSPASFQVVCPRCGVPHLLFLDVDHYEGLLNMGADVEARIRALSLNPPEVPCPLCVLRFGHRWED